jgi:hypothetical protein
MSDWKTTTGKLSFGSGIQTIPRIKTIKREAKQLKKATGLKHTYALDEVCRQYGFRDYKHYLLVFGEE